MFLINFLSPLEAYGHHLPSFCLISLFHDMFVFADSYSFPILPLIHFFILNSSSITYQLVSSDFFTQCIVSLSTFSSYLFITCLRNQSDQMYLHSMVSDIWNQFSLYFLSVPPISLLCSPSMFICNIVYKISSLYVCLETQHKFTVAKLNPYAWILISTNNNQLL